MTSIDQTDGPVADTDYDAIVIGAGFGGIYMLHKLRNELEDLAPWLGLGTIAA